MQVITLNRTNGEVAGTVGFAMPFDPFLPDLFDMVSNSWDAFLSQNPEGDIGEFIDFHNDGEQPDIVQIFVEFYQPQPG